MSKFFGSFALLLALSWGLAGACPALQNSGALPVLGIGSPTYYCANHSDMLDNGNPSKLGDLSQSGWGRSVQICSKNCSYAPIVPSDPNSELMPVSCGGGMHDMQYYVEPPPPAKGVTAIHIANPSCTGSMPSKAPPPPPAPRRQAQAPPTPQPSSQP
ncbi:MAG TPA: hypothetical protein VKT72_17355 [Candidatus Baltobacteraceae bacterium]|nr:hypothetical protein [Candidatus Baltobacteraceae bacterium]